MVRRARRAALGALLVALAGCGDRDAPERAAEPPGVTQPPARSTPARPPGVRRAAPDPEREALTRLLVPPGVPTTGDGRPAEPADLAVVQRWLAALTRGDIDAAADTFADGTRVQNLRPITRLADRAARRAFNAGFPCGAEVERASSVEGYVIVTYRLTDRVDSPCDGPGGSAAGAIKVEGGRMTEWYRLPDPPGGPEPGPVV